MPKVTFNPDEYGKVLENMKKINNYRFGLEFSGIYAQMAVMNKWVNRIRGSDRGMWIIGTKSMGKGETLKIAQSIEEKNILINSDDLTFTFLINYINEKKLNRLCIVLEDVSTVIDNDYHTKQFFNLISKLLWDRTLGKGTKEVIEMGLKKFNVEMEGTSVLIGGTPENVAHIKKSYMAYKTMWSDRITEYYLFFDKHSVDVIKSNIVKNQFINSHMKMPDFGYVIPKEKYEVTYDIDEKYLEILYKDTLSEQHTDNRGMSYLINDLKTLAYMNNRNYICESDIYFYELFKLNLMFSKASRISYVMTFYALQNAKIDYICEKSGLSHHYVQTALYQSKPYINYSRNDNFIKINPELVKMLKNQREFIKKYVGYGD